jgi:hypothetical protein
MIDLSCKIDPAELSRLRINVAAMQEATGKEMKKVVRNTSRDLCRAALKHTIVAPVKEKRLFTVVNHRYTGERVVFPNKNGPEWVKIKNRGFAKAGWSACLTKLGVARQSGGGQSGLARKNNADKYAKVSETGSYFEFGMLVANEVPFIEDMDSGRNRMHVPLHILEKSISDVNTKMEQYLESTGREIVRRSNLS